MPGCPPWFGVLGQSWGKLRTTVLETGGQGEHSDLKNIGDWRAAPWPVCVSLSAACCIELALQRSCSISEPCCQ